VSKTSNLQEGGVHVAPGSNTAHFTFAGNSYVAKWAKPLPPPSITALRFCIEAATEQEAMGQLDQSKTVH